MPNHPATPNSAARAEFQHPDIIDIQTFGFWIYLMSDVVLFAALFATYAVLGNNYAGGPTAQDIFHLPYLFVETMFLLFSGTACSMTMLAVDRSSKNGVLLGLVVTFVLGLGFIAMEIHSLYQLVATGAGPQHSAFLSSFFTLVGTHGVHLAVGLLWMATMMAQVLFKGFTKPVLSRLMRLSMYWYFQVIVWICVFTIVYLMRVA